MRRKERQQSTEFALKLFNDCQYATLSTVGADNSAYGVPISPVLIDNVIYFHSAMEGHKIDNIKFNKNVCISCVGNTKLAPEKFSTEYESAIIFGECSLISDDEEKIFALRKLCEKYAPTNMASFDQAVNRSLNRTLICKISIKEITGKAKIYKS